MMPWMSLLLPAVVMQVRLPKYCIAAVFWCSTWPRKSTWGQRRSGECVCGAVV